MQRKIWMIIEVVKDKDTKSSDFFTLFEDFEKVLYEFIFVKEFLNLVFVVDVEVWNEDEFEVLTKRFEQSEDEVDFNDYLTKIGAKFFVEEKEK